MLLILSLSKDEGCNARSQHRKSPAFRHTGPQMAKTLNGRDYRFPPPAARRGGSPSTAGGVNSRVVGTVTRARSS